MKTYEIHIRGITPLIWNRMKKELDDEQRKLKKDQLREWEEKNWKRKAEFDDKGNLLVPPEWIKSALIEAAKKTRMVPSFATTKQQTYTYYMQSSMVTEVQPIGKIEELEPFGAFVGGRGAGSKTKVWKIRPHLKIWKPTFRLKDPDGRMTNDELKELLEFAGMMVGIGDNRINNFGRFEVDKMVEVN